MEVENGIWITHLYCGKCLCVCYFVKPNPNLMNVFNICDNSNNTLTGLIQWSAENELIHRQIGNSILHRQFEMNFMNANYLFWYNFLWSVSAKVFGNNFTSDFTSIRHLFNLRQWYACHWGSQTQFYIAFNSLSLPLYPNWHCFIRSMMVNIVTYNLVNIIWAKLTGKRFIHIIANYLIILCFRCVLWQHGWWMVAL